VASLLTGCGAAGLLARPAPGLVTGNEAPDQLKEGAAQATSILGVIAWGDAGISAAMADGGIKKIHHVDVDTFNVLGIYATYTIKVYGE
jgi:hypothetical protein